MQEIAKTLKDSNATMTTVYAFANMLDRHNPNFDLNRFMVAVNMENWVDDYFEDSG